ncbi:hypothetical protein ISF6_3546 [Piscinibacter sakaiensis]|uniref:Uncharacterized protein n=1 Tax=Piscinibacter sakaiensis TaxID=1547922 RepID=A0A0K8P4R0_PISS1|nr:hypothetical protein ISF6_3546 [Piscinibacter sakaiensis]
MLRAPRRRAANGAEQAAFAAHFRRSGVRPAARRGSRAGAAGR